MGIETGLLIKALRGRSKGPTAKKVADIAARHYGALTTGVRLGLGAADLVHGLVGTGVMKGTLDGLRKASGGRLPKWSPALARPVHFVPQPAPPQRAERLVYFPSCAARNMGPQRGHDGVEMLPAWPIGCSSAPVSTCCIRQPWPASAVASPSRAKG